MGESKEVSKSAELALTLAISVRPYLSEYVAEARKKHPEFSDEQIIEWTANRTWDMGVENFIKAFKEGKGVYVGIVTTLLKEEVFHGS